MSTRYIEGITIPRSTIIRARGGGFRVYRPYVQHGRWGVLRYGVPFGRAMCRGCDCTTEWGCLPPCSWADARGILCSRCAERIVR